jgi:hypothetical protein
MGRGQALKPTTNLTGACEICGHAREIQNQIFGPLEMAFVHIDFAKLAGAQEGDEGPRCRTTRLAQCQCIKRHLQLMMMNAIEDGGIVHAIAFPIHEETLALPLEVQIDLPRDAKALEFQYEGFLAAKVLSLGKSLLGPNVFLSEKIGQRFAGSIAAFFIKVGGTGIRKGLIGGRTEIPTLQDSVKIGTKGGAGRSVLIFFLTRMEGLG